MGVVVTGSLCHRRPRLRQHRFGRVAAAVTDRGAMPLSLIPPSGMQEGDTK